MILRREEKRTTRKLRIHEARKTAIWKPKAVVRFVQPLLGILFKENTFNYRKLYLGWLGKVLVNGRTCGSSEEKHPRTGS